MCEAIEKRRFIRLSVIMEPHLYIPSPKKRSGRLLFFMKPIGTLQRYVVDYRRIYLVPEGVSLWAIIYTFVLYAGLIMINQQIIV